MTERLVDVSLRNKPVLHTFPVTVAPSDIALPDAKYEEKALRAAAYAQLVPDADLKNLTTQMHVSRGGRLEPYGDDLEAGAQTKQRLAQAVNERAYFLWEAGGRPQGRSLEYWHHAQIQHLQMRAYVLWQQEGCPTGRAEEHWRRTCEFESH